MDRWLDALEPLPLGPMSDDDGGDGGHDVGAVANDPGRPIAMGRRPFLQRALWIGGGVLGGAGASAIVDAWREDETAGAANGSTNVGSLAALEERFAASTDPLVIDDERPFVFVVSFRTSDVDAALDVYPASLHDGIRIGVVALSARCTHLGCRTEHCGSSGLFECPCHGSKFNAVGEKVGGPAPRGLDHHPVHLTPSMDVVVDRTRLVLGVGFDVTTPGHDARGQGCV